VSSAAASGGMGSGAVATVGGGGATGTVETASAAASTSTSSSTLSTTSGDSAGVTATSGSVGGGGASATGVASGTGGSSAGEVDAARMVADMGFGTNIGNTLENTTEWETGWGQPLISQAFIEGIAGRGIKTVRVPVAWDTYASDGEIDLDKLNRVKEVVGWIEAAGMYSIVNIHWDGGWIFNEGTADEFQLTEGVKTKFASYWHQIAAGFADVQHELIFEGLNEEAKFYVNGDSSGEPDYAALNELNQLFVTTVRAETGYNKTRALLIAGFVTDIELTCVDAFTVPEDPAGPGKLFLSLHYYTPYTFCGLDTVETWGSPATTWGTDAEKAQLESLFDKASAFSTSRNIPIILGEFGVTPGSNYVREPASRVLWMTSVSQAALARGIVPVLWDTGSEIDRADGAFSPEFQAVMDSVGSN
jgi:endoglucanase